MSNYMILSHHASITPTEGGTFVLLNDGIQSGTEEWGTLEEAERAWRKENPDTNLDEMARDLVGDGKKPNLFFVTVDGKTLAAFDDMDRAKWYAQRSFGAPAAQEYPVQIEDRLMGVVWENGASEAEQEPAEEDEAYCEKTGGMHKLDIRAEYADIPTSSNRGIVVDVWCKLCGKSGSIAIEPNEVNW